MTFHIVLLIQINPRLDFGGNFFHINIYAKNTIILFIWKVSGEVSTWKVYTKDDKHASSSTPFFKKLLALKCKA
jgi:hypothetical protein